IKAQRPVNTGFCAFTLPEGKTAGQVFGKRQGRNKNELGGSYLPITDVMVNGVGGLALRPSVTDHLIYKTWDFQRSIVLP
ncbi:hypothetical protein, partial [Acinetobacter baumannii]|uniref:hypothetical protein n=1 Tax=Acinetobacter baumannii TaxID=470 RepID=UPI001BB464F2